MFFKTTNQSYLNYEEQNLYEVCIRFSNESALIERKFFINVEDVNEPPFNFQCSSRNLKSQPKYRIKYSLNFSLDLTGICTVFDDDFNQALKFEIKHFDNVENETLYELICTDNGEPPLSVNKTLFCKFNLYNCSYVLRYQHG